MLRKFYTFYNEYEFAVVILVVDLREPIRGSHARTCAFLVDARVAVTGGHHHHLPRGVRSLIF